jgi:hypothetical protein
VIINIYEALIKIGVRGKKKKKKKKPKEKKKEEKRKT